MSLRDALNHEISEKDEDHFWSWVDTAGPNECWEWRGSVGSHGYGRLWLTTTQEHMLAHRFSLSLRQPLRQGLEVDHLCFNKLCVNPDHLEEVTPAENRRRAVAARPPVASCKRGHPYDESNTIINSKGYRECRQCLRAKHRRKRAREVADREPRYCRGCGEPIEREADTRKQFCGARCKNRIWWRENKGKA